MGKNLVRETITTNGTWTAPAGVTSARILSYSSLIQQCEGCDSGSTVAITPTGQLYAWGANTHGELGVGNVIPGSVPLAVAESRIWQMVSAGAGFIMGLEATTGLLYGWGWNNLGQLANETSGNASSSPILTSNTFNWRQVSAGTEHIIAIDSTGQAHGAGLNTSGQLGYGNVSSPVTGLNSVILGGITWQTAAAGGRHSAGIDTAGNAYAWGSNAAGQLGLGDVTDRSSPVAVIGGLKFKKIVCGGTQTFGITTSNDLYAWGQNTNGELGTGNVTAVSSPVLVLGGFKWADVKSNEGGFSTAISTTGLTTGGDVYCWGGNANGQLGDGTVVAKSSPVLVLGGFKYTQILNGGIYNGGITNNGAMYMWGGNSSGQLGNNGITPASSPIVVSAFAGIRGPSFWQSAQAKILNEQILTVVPGTSYTVTLLADMMSLGSQGLAQGLGVTFIVIEYFA